MTKSLVRQDEYRPIVYLVLDALNSDHSRRAYDKALTDFLRWYTEQGRPGLSKAIVQQYRAELLATGLAPRSVNQRLSAIRKLAAEAADNGMLDAQLAGGIAKVKGVSASGVRTGNWLTLGQAQQLIDAPDTATLKGLRDRALLAVMIGGGLRRSEVAGLEFAHLALRDGRWMILDMIGKRQHVRSVPVPLWLKQAIDIWARAAGITEGRVFRSMNKADRVTGATLTAQAVLDVVKHYGQATGLDIAPHDLRRTFAKLARAGGSGLEQIQLSLGHASVLTTERYLGTQQDLTDAPADRLGLHL